MFDIDELEIVYLKKSTGIQTETVETKSVGSQTETKQNNLFIYSGMHFYKYLNYISFAWISYYLFNFFQTKRN